MGRFSLSIRLAFSLALASIVLIVGALWRGYFLDGQWKLLLPLWALCCWFSFSKLKRGQPKCWLSWDGSMWRVLTLLPNFETEPPLQTGYAMTVHLDFQRLLFVSLRNHQGEHRWFWLAKDSFPDRWHGFRCAVYSRSEAFSS